MMPDVRRFSILVVDDDDSARWGLAKLLAGDGFMTDEAADGQEALAKVAVRRYDLVITDIRMPRLGGLEFLKQIKDDYQGRIIVVTAFGSPETWCAALDFGAVVGIIRSIQVRMNRR
jgi:CheY-like chemotaxis protein